MYFFLDLMMLKLYIQEYCVCTNLSDSNVGGGGVSSDIDDGFLFCVDFTESGLIEYTCG